MTYSLIGIVCALVVARYIARAIFASVPMSGFYHGFDAGGWHGPDTDPTVEALTSFSFPRGPQRSDDLPGDSGAKTLK
jgi:hypothetical protein